MAGAGEFSDELWGFVRGGNFLISSRPVIFSGRTLFQGVS